MTVRCCNSGSKDCQAKDAVASIEMDSNPQWKDPKSSGWVVFQLPKQCKGSRWELAELQGGTEVFYMFDFAMTSNLLKKEELPVATDLKVNGWCVKNQKVQL